MSTRARIYRPARTAVQAGRAKTRSWVVEPEPRSRREPDRLIGWVGSDDTEQQVTLTFPTKEAAIAYCERHGIDYSVTEPHQRVVRPKSYAENFIRRV
ncbi:MAG TPA: ETC complex I subunit [Geminicoccaceae bacterium]|nr:ETC complex I subunit [Geminicoccaceae bacterium]